MLKNKTAIVTGAGQGIGKGIALELAKEGCNVVVSDVNKETAEEAAEEIAKETKAKTYAFACDVSQKKEVDDLVSAAVEQFGKVDILVNNAGIYPFVSFEKMKESDWDKVMDINLKGIFLCCKAASERMKQGAKIVNISSIASIVGFEGLVHYCASKGGVNAMTRALALELASKKINVNAVAPGAIKTPGATGAMTEEAVKQTISAIPLAKFGEPADIASAVAFLASNKADYITGQVIVVDGGWTLR